MVRAFLPAKTATRTVVRRGPISGLGMNVARYAPTSMCGDPAFDVPGPYDTMPSSPNYAAMKRSTMQYGRQLRGLGHGGGGGGGHHGGGGGGGGHHGGGGGRGGGPRGGYGPYWDGSLDTGFLETSIVDCGPSCIWDGYACQCPDMSSDRPAVPIGLARAVSGLGAVPQSKYHHDSWSGDDPAVLEADELDDSVGNGVFDGAGAAPIQHAGNGVFEAHYAEPGYLYRERMGEPGEIIDATTGNPIIYHPNAGQSSHEDILRTYRRFDQETPRYYGPMGKGRPSGFVRSTSTSNAVTPPASIPPLAGLGLSLTDSSSLLPYAVGGLLLGVAAGILYSSMKKGG